jgi:hypothetical protein
MSNFVLKDGKTGNTAEVDTNNKLKTFSTSQPEETTSALEGDTFTINTGDITLTTASESGVFFVENTDIVPWILTRLFFNVGTSTSGTGHWRLRILKNVSAGTLVSAGTAVTPQNLNFGQAKTLTSTSLKGVEGSTVTDGTEVINSIVPTDAIRVLISDNPIIVEPGSTYTVAITPQASNTSFLVQTGLVLIRSME